ncbi:MAG: exonuclease SbcCD subunit D [Nitrososphaerales archaeon]
MRILQTSDNHLGEIAYSKVDPSTGLNARGLDYLSAFKSIGKIALNERVDVFLIAGDLFTRTNLHPYYTLEVTRILKRLAKAGIMTLIVSGNSETPKTGAALNPLTILSEIDNVFVATEPNTFILGSYDFVCVPASKIFDEASHDFAEMLDKALEKSTSDKKILAAHIPVAQAVAGSEEFAEPFVGKYLNPSEIPDGFSYVALGHMHKFQQVKHAVPMFYSGSSERFDFGEENDEKYALLVEFEEGVRVKPVRLPTRKMVTIIDFDCSGSSASKITKFVTESIDIKAKEMKNALVRIKLDNIDVHENRSINWIPIVEKLKECRVFDYKIQARTTVSLPESGMLGERYVLPPAKELELYVKSKRQLAKNSSKLLKLGNEVIRKVEEKQ